MRAGNAKQEINLTWPFIGVKTYFIENMFFLSTFSDLSESKWLKKLSQGSVHQTLIELSPLDSVIDSKKFSRWNDLTRFILTKFLHWDELTQSL